MYWRQRLNTVKLAPFIPGCIPGCTPPGIVVGSLITWTPYPGPTNNLEPTYPGRSGSLSEKLVRTFSDEVLLARPLVGHSAGLLFILAFSRFCSINGLK
eukprot:scaffold2338_cov133-Chaetoceros_neogracile.AAC.1